MRARLSSHEEALRRAVPGHADCGAPSVATALGLGAEEHPAVVLEAGLTSLALQLLERCTEPGADLDAAEAPALRAGRS